jgi:SAM-dependent methyltransferase
MWCLNKIAKEDLERKTFLSVGTNSEVDLVDLTKRGAAVTVIRDSSDAAEGVRETLPFADQSFDYVWCTNLSYIPGADARIQDILRVLKHGGRAFALLSAENSYHHWVIQFFRRGLVSGLLTQYSLSEVLARGEQTRSSIPNRSIRHYTKQRAHQLFASFRGKRVVRHGRILLVEAVK